MSKKIRYSLITFGFLIFLILAPFLVMYVGGWVYDSPNHKFIKTGILAIKTNPVDGKIEIDDKIFPVTYDNIKFLRPKEYNIKISKDGYFTWQKKLPIFSNQVTWASPAGGEIFLFKNIPENTLLAENILDFWQNGNTLLLLEKNKLTLADTTGKINKIWQLTNPANKILISPDEKTILIFPENPKAFVSLISISKPEIISLTEITPEIQIQFSPDNKIYFLKQTALYRLIEPYQKAEKILNEATAFTFSNKNIYFIGKDLENKTGLFVSNLDGQKTEVLNEYLPVFASAKIFVNFEKEIFLLLNSSIYKVNNQGLEKLADDVLNWNTQSQNSSIVFFNGGELNFYNPFKKTVNFVSRSSQSDNFSILNLEINYLFTLANSKILAFELDTRDKQNIFELFSGKQISKFSLNNNSKEMFVLDDGNLNKIEIR
jgi:hypothetical protein